MLSLALAWYISWYIVTRVRRRCASHLVFLGTATLPALPTADIVLPNDAKGPVEYVNHRLLDPRILLKGL